MKQLRQFTLALSTSIITPFYVDIDKETQTHNIGIAR